MGVWGFWVVVDTFGFSWGDVGEDRFCGGWLAILEMFFGKSKNFSEKVYVCYNILQWIKSKGL